MEDKINLGDVTLAEYNLIMKQLAAGQLGECIELFMRFNATAQAHHNAQQAKQAQQAPQGPQPTQTLPPPAA